jgi:hypothetical protein
MTRGKRRAGLHGHDKQQAHLRDERGGTYEAGRGARRNRTRSDVPEGLRRQPKGPYDKQAGRGGKLARR